MKQEALKNSITMSKKEELGGRHRKSGELMRKTSDCLNQSFTNEEEDLILELHGTIGSRWSIIATQLPGRTNSEVRNIWNTKLRKNLIAMGIECRPLLCQIPADYGNIRAKL